MKDKNQPDLFVRYMAGTPYIIVCIGLAFLEIPEITLPVIVVYVTVYILYFGALSTMFILFKYRRDPVVVSGTKNSNVMESGPPFVHTASIEKRYYENVTNWAFKKAFWVSFITTAITIIVISPYL